MHKKLLAVNKPKGVCTPKLQEYYEGLIQELIFRAQKAEKGEVTANNQLVKLEQQLALEKQALEGSLYDTQVKLATYKNLLLQVKQMFDVIENAVVEIGHGIKETSIGSQQAEAAMSVVREATVSVKDATQAVSAIASKLSERTAKDMKNGQSILNMFKGLEDVLAGVNNSSGEISVLLQDVMKIVSQIGLLAMNGAIEAAHAGSAGAGFMVVVDEMRKLYENANVKLKNAKKNISQDVLAKIQELSQVSVFVKSALEGNAKSARETADDGKNIYLQAESLETNAEQTAQAVIEFASGMEETSGIMKSIDEHMQQISSVQKKSNALLNMATLVENLIAQVGKQVDSVAEMLMVSGLKLTGLSDKKSPLVAGLYMLIATYKDIPLKLRNGIQSDQGQELYAIVYGVNAVENDCQVAFSKMCALNKVYKLTDTTSPIYPYIEAWSKSANINFAEFVSGKANANAIGITAIQDIYSAKLPLTDQEILKRFKVVSATLSGAMINAGLAYLSIAFVTEQRTAQEAGIMAIYPSLLREELRKKTKLWPNNLQ